MSASFPLIAAVLMVVMIIVSIVAAAGLATAYSATMSADNDTYTIAPGSTITVKIINAPENALNNASFKTITVLDSDSLAADSHFTEVVTFTDRNATVKVHAASDTPIGEYTMTFTPTMNSTTQAVPITLEVKKSVTQQIAGNVNMIVGGIILIVIALIMMYAIKNSKAKKVTVPLAWIMGIGGIALIAYVIYLAGMALA